MHMLLLLGVLLCCRYSVVFEDNRITKDLLPDLSKVCECINKIKIVHVIYSVECVYNHTVSP